MTTYVSLDPGGTTGVYTWRNNHDNPLNVGHAQQLTGEHHLQLWWLLRDRHPDVVICEAFTWRPNPSPVQGGGAHQVELISKEYIGTAKTWCALERQQGHKVQYVEQQASQGKGFWTDSKLKRVGLYKPGMPHAMDAIRHFLYYMTFKLNNQTWVERLRN